MAPDDPPVLFDDVVDLAAALSRAQRLHLLEHLGGVGEPGYVLSCLVGRVDLSEQPASRRVGDRLQLPRPGPQPEAIRGDGGFFVHVSHPSRTRCSGIG